MHNGAKISEWNEKPFTLDCVGTVDVTLWGEKYEIPIMRRYLCIDLGREQCIEFDEETEPNFLGERCQREDFIAGDYGQKEEMEMEVTLV